MTSDPLFVKAVQGLLEASSKEVIDEVTAKFEAEREAHDCADVLLVDPGGRILVSLTRATLAEEELSSIEEALLEQRPVVTNFHRPRGNAEVHVSVVAPIRAGGERSRPAAVLVQLFKAEDFLYPLLQAWPTPSPSAETLLVERRGEQVLFLNELRHKKDTALSFGIPLSRAEVPAVQAVLGAEGVFEGVDYRGVEALAFSTKVPSTPWHMVSKVDTAEAFATLRTQSLLMLGLLAALVVLVLAARAAFRLRELRQDRLEEVVRERTAELGKLSRAVEQSPASVVITDRTGEIQYVNPSFTVATGYTAEEALGQNPRMLRGGQHPASFYKELWDTLLAGKIWKGEFCNRRKSGELFWESASISSIKDGDGRTTHYVAVKLDITERKRAEALLSQRADQLSKAQALAQVGSWELDLVRNQLFWTDEIYRIFGLRPQEFGATYEAFLERVHPEDRAAVDAAYTDSLREGRDAYEIDHRVVRRSDGELRFVHEKCEHIKDASGRVVRSVGMVHDITERRRAEEAMEVAKIAAEAANRAKSVFLANMSHEIRTPLNAVLGFSQLLLRDPGLTPRQKEQLGIMNRAGDHLLELISDILDLARIEAGRAVLEERSFDLHRTIDELAAMFRMRAEEKGLAFDVQIAAGVPRLVLADQHKLRQVMINLLSNAVKFTQRGCVALAVEGGYGLVVDVTDTGPGIAPKEQGRLFIPFEQGAASAEKGGTGLGLAISRQYARLLGGDIEMTSELGKGSRFRLTLPVKPHAAVSAVVEHRRVAHLKDGQAAQRILIADDREDNRVLLRETLSAVGFTTREVGDGREAVAVFDEWAPHAVLMDMKMPDMSGFEATRRIKATAWGRKISVVAVSAGALDFNRQDALDAGADEFIAKPFKEAELFAVLGRRLRLEYDYLPAATEREPPVRDRATALAELASLEPEAIGRLRRAAVSARYDELLEIIAAAEGSAPRAAAEIRALTERFDYTGIAGLLDEAEKDIG